MAELDELFASESDEDSQSDDDDCGPTPVHGPPSPGRLDPASGDRGTPAVTAAPTSTDSSADHGCDCENRCNADSGPPSPRRPGLKEYNVRPAATVRKALNAQDMVLRGGWAEECVKASN